MCFLFFCLLCLSVCLSVRVCLGVGRCGFGCDNFLVERGVGHLKKSNSSNSDTVSNTKL